MDNSLDKKNQIFFRDKKDVNRRLLQPKTNYLIDDLRDFHFHLNNINVDENQNIDNDKIKDIIARYKKVYKFLLNIKDDLTQVLLESDFRNSERNLILNSKKQIIEDNISSIQSSIDDIINRNISKIKDVKDLEVAENGLSSIKEKINQKSELHKKQKEISSKIDSKNALDNSNYNEKLQARILNYIGQEGDIDSLEEILDDKRKSIKNLLAMISNKKLDVDILGEVNSSLEDLFNKLNINIAKSDEELFVSDENTNGDGLNTPMTDRERDLSFKKVEALLNMIRFRGFDIADCDYDLNDLTDPECKGNKRYKNDLFYFYIPKLNKSIIISDEVVSNGRETVTTEINNEDKKSMLGHYRDSTFVIVGPLKKEHLMGGKNRVSKKSIENKGYLGKKYNFYSKEDWIYKTEKFLFDLDNDSDVFTEFTNGSIDKNIEEIDPITGFTLTELRNLLVEILNDRKIDIKNLTINQYRDVASKYNSNAIKKIPTSLRGCIRIAIGLPHIEDKKYLIPKIFGGSEDLISEYEINDFINRSSEEFLLSNKNNFYNFKKLYRKGVLLKNNLGSNYDMWYGEYVSNMKKTETFNVVRECYIDDKKVRDIENLKDHSIVRYFEGVPKSSRTLSKYLGGTCCVDTDYQKLLRDRLELCVLLEDGKIDEETFKRKLVIINNFIRDLEREYFDRFWSGELEKLEKEIEKEDSDSVDTTDTFISSFGELEQRKKVQEFYSKNDNISSNEILENIDKPHKVVIRKIKKSEIKSDKMWIDVGFGGGIGGAIEVTEDIKDLVSGFNVGDILDVFIYNKVDDSYFECSIPDSLNGEISIFKNTKNSGLLLSDIKEDCKYEAIVTNSIDAKFGKATFIQINDSIKGILHDDVGHKRGKKLSVSLKKMPDSIGKLAEFSIYDEINAVISSFNKENNSKLSIDNIDDEIAYDAIVNNIHIKGTSSGEKEMIFVSLNSHVSGILECRDNIDLSKGDIVKVFFHKINMIKNDEKLSFRVYNDKYYDVYKKKDILYSKHPDNENLDIKDLKKGHLYYLCVHRHDRPNESIYAFLNDNIEAKLKISLDDFNQYRRGTIISLMRNGKKFQRPTAMGSALLNNKKIK